MHGFLERLNPLAPAVLRVGLALVFLWFGSQQLLETERWTGFVPEAIVAMSGLSAELLVRANGVFEIIFGSLLLLGFQTRIVALLLALHMFQITGTVGYSAIGVRDFGLSVATLAIFLQGADEYGLDKLLGKGVAKRV